MNNDDLQERVTEIENLIASNQLNKAAKRLMDFSKDFSFDRGRQRQAISIKGEYTALREAQIGYEKTDDINRRFRKLGDDILKLTDLIKKEFDDLAFTENKAEENKIDKLHDLVTNTQIDNIKSPQRSALETEFEKRKREFIKKKKKT